MRTAASQAGNSAPDTSCPREVLAAIGTSIKEALRVIATGERQIVAAFFIGDSEIPAGLAPLQAVWLNSATTGAELGQQVGELVSQGGFDFARMIHKLGVQRDKFLGVIGAPRAGLQPRVPLDTNRAGKLARAVGAEKFLSLLLQLAIHAERESQLARRGADRPHR